MTQRRYMGITLLTIATVIIVGLVYIMMGGKLPHFGTTTSDAPIVNNAPNDGGADGLGTPNQIKTYKLDEMGAGVASAAIFNRDINGDGKMDKITRTHVETGTAHAYDEYKIELNTDDKFIDITPDGLRTTTGAECALQKIHFTMRPKFQITKISRPWLDTWDTPSMATQTTYELDNGKLNIIDRRDRGVICDVSTLI